MTDRRGFLQRGALALASLALPWRVAARPVEPASEPAPAFSFGVVADVQYADKPTAGARQYRQSLTKLDDCVAFWNAAPLAFVIQLGDLADSGGLGTLARVAAGFAKARAPRHSVLGNHDFVASRAEVMATLQIATAYRSFRRPGWRFIVLDGMDTSVGGGWAADDPHHIAGQAINAALERANSPLAGEWNGAVGPAQRQWLARELAAATALGEKVIVFCHLPTLPGSCQPDLLLWDHADVVALLDTCPTLVAYLCGHDHHGGYAQRRGVHYLTFPGMVEHAAKDSSFIVDVHADRLVVRMQSGWQRQLVFPAPRRSSAGAADDTAERAA